MGTIKKNFVYSSILTTANYIFPLITYPYVSRVLGVTNIGICNFIDSIINYYILFSMMGIGAVAIREVAKNRDKPTALSRSFSSLFLLNTISTIMISVVLLLSIAFVPKLHEYSHLMYIGLFKVVFNYLLIEWFYKGIEDFKYITNRSLVIKTLYVVSIFVFVRNQSDFSVYYLLSMLMVAFNAIFNLFHSRKFIHFTFKSINFRPFFFSFFVLGFYTILTSMYTTFNVAYLGFVSGETEVGYYTTATKLQGIFLGLFSAFTGVMLPRMSSLVSLNKKKDFNILLQKSFHVLFLFSFPVILYTVIYAPQIISLMAGPGYENAIIPMRIVMPLILVIGFEQIEIIQVLMPLKKDKAILMNSFVGALIGVCCNILLVGEMKSIGSAIVWIVSEMVVLLMAQHFVVKYTGVKFPIKSLLKYSVAALPCAFLLVVSTKLISNDFGSLLVGGIVVLFYYLWIYIVVLKERFIISNIKRVRDRFRV